MQRLIRCLIVGTTFFSVAAARATTEPDPLQFDRSTAVHYALAHNLELQAARTVVERAQARSIDAGRLDNPSLGVRGQSDALDANEGVHTVEVGFSQRFPVTDRLRRERDVAVVEIELAEAEVRERERQLAVRVAHAFTKVQQLRAELKLLKEKLAVTRELAEFIDSRVDSAEASPVEANRLQIVAFQESQTLADLEIALKEANARLADLLGIEPAVRFQLRGAFSDQPAETLPNLDPDWLSGHPAYRMREILAELADAEISLAEARRWGDVAVEVFVESEYGGDPDAGLERENFAGLAFRVPLPLHQQNRGEIEARRTERRRAALEMDALRQRLQREERLQADKAEHALEHLEVFTEGVSHLMEANIQDMEQAYATGQIDFDALLRSREQNLEIRKHQLELRAEYETARIDWAAATGQTHIF